MSYTHKQILIPNTLSGMILRHLATVYYAIMFRSLNTGKGAALLATFFLVFFMSSVHIVQGQENIPPEPAPNSRVFLVGTSHGLFRIQAGGPDSGISSSYPLWTDGSVKRILHAGEGWFLVTSRGLLYTKDFKTFDDRSNGLPHIMIRTVSSDSSVPDVLDERIKDIQAFAVDPGNPLHCALCTDSEVFTSADGGSSWLSIGAPSTVPGYKAISFGPDPALELFVAHSFKGVYSFPLSPGGVWQNVSEGLARVYGSIYEEVSSFALVPLDSISAPAADITSTIPTGQNVSPNPRYALWAGTSFLGRLYLWDPLTKHFREMWTDKADFGTIESLTSSGPGTLDAISATSAPTGSAVSFSITGSKGVEMVRDDGKNRLMARIVSSVDGLASCIVEEPQSPTAPNRSMLDLSELWLLTGRKSDTPAAHRRAEADGKLGIYLQTGFVIDPASRAKYFDLIKSKGINTIVVDAKDDSGRLRFVPKSPLLASMGQVGSALDIESFVREAKSRGLYLVARIVVFKDESLYKWHGGELAVRDSVTGTPWRGMKTVTGQNSTAPTQQPNGEYWVDPYSSAVWRYNVEIAKEVVARGFDEVQFDYIRFPTDGDNISNVWFPAQAQGMDHASAIESFLRYARQEIAAPISIDIYGSNGWYRTGSRTGQDVEMLSKYVDVFCPMLYPSHFEQDFLAYNPSELRPYRIYMRGTLRNYRIAREASIIRPYVQAFWLNVSYDRQYYDTTYVLREIQGVADGTDQGMTFWNNSGRYTDVPDLKNPVNLVIR
jgi:hypothetical protein